jgi:uncharacterized cupin superfamily protein
MISHAAIEVARTAVDLTPSPIDPSWIIKGNPFAQSTLLTKSADGLAWTMVWQCSEGSFNWYYDLDETIMVLEGAFILENDTLSPTRYGPGDVIFFKDGAHAKWHVEGHVQSSRSSAGPRRCSSATRCGASPRSRELSWPLGNADNRACLPRLFPSSARPFVFLREQMVSGLRNLICLFTSP